MERAIVFPSGGLRLEGRVFSGGNWGALICHPHPLYGGSMENNVVHAAADAFRRRMWTALRFNFRGVGGSEGRSGDGEAEVEDVRAALAFLHEELGIPMERSVLVGYSFGAWVGLRALGCWEPLFGWVAISPPVGIWDFSELTDIQGRKLLIAGDRDTFCPEEALRSFAGLLSEPKETLIIPGADHFFWDFEPLLSREMERIISEWPGSPKPD